MNTLRFLAQSPNFQRYSCIVVSTVCVVASLALAYFCIKNGLGFEKHGKIIGDLALQWRGTLLEYGAVTYVTAMVVNVVVALRRIFAPDSKYTTKAAMMQLLYSFGSPIFGPYVLFNHIREHGHEHWKVICDNTLFLRRH